MLSHLSLGVKNLELAGLFYDAALGALGYERVWSMPQGIGYGPPGKEDKLAIFDESDANVSLAAGGQDAGPPGPRPQYSPTYYAAFVIDLDGHKLEAVHQ